MPEMRIRTKMKNVASDRARRENVPRHILFCIGNYIFYVEKLPAECIGDEGNEKRKEMEKN